MNWSLIPLFLVVAQGIVLIAFLTLKRKALNVNAFWLLGLCVFAVITVTDSILYLGKFYYSVPYLIGIAFPVSLLFPPLILGYIRSMLGVSPSRKFYLHFVPFVICVVALVPFFILPNEVKLLFFFEDVEHESISSVLVLPGLVLVFLGSMVQFPLYFYLCKRALKEQSLQFKEVTSSEQLTQFTWLHVLLYFSLIIWLLSCVQILVGAAFGVTDLLVWWINFLIGITIYAFNYYALNQQTLLNHLLPPSETTLPLADEVTDIDDEVANNVDDIDSDKTHSSKYQNSSLDGDISKIVLADIHQKVTGEQLYLDPLLSLPSVSDKIGHSTHHVSQAINQNMNVNFFDYINGFRVEHAKALLIRNKQKNILDIALECGFNSKSAFYKAFKKATLTTPSNFRASHSNSAE